MLMFLHVLKSFTPIFLQLRFFADYLIAAFLYYMFILVND